MDGGEEREEEKRCRAGKGKEFVVGGGKVERGVRSPGDEDGERERGWGRNNSKRKGGRSCLM